MYSTPEGLRYNDVSTFPGESSLNTTAVFRQSRGLCQTTFEGEDLIASKSRTFSTFLPEKRERSFREKSSFLIAKQNIRELGELALALREQNQNEVKNVQNEYEKSHLFLFHMVYFFICRGALNWKPFIFVLTVRFLFLSINIPLSNTKEKMSLRNRLDIEK
eukprot:snap_masked-scaffold_78-processed-gene-0.33-mRNA-1 protein AED:1.00 eAED:1.00 QI:0/0/0/0/1/1/3/0/161